MILSGVPTGPCSGVTLSRPTKPPEGSASIASGPSSAARDAASASLPDVVASANNTSAISRPSPAPTIISAARNLRFLDLDLAGDNRELRGCALKRLPSLRLAFRVGGDDLVGEGAARIARWDDPDRRPEIVGGRALRRRRMRPISGVELLPIGQLDDQALESLIVERLAALIDHANAPDHLFQAFELIVQHAERPRRALLSAAHQVAFEEQLFRGLCVRGRGQSKACHRQSESRQHHVSHTAPFTCIAAGRRQPWSSCAHEDITPWQRDQSRLPQFSVSSLVASIPYWPDPIEHGTDWATELTFRVVCGRAREQRSAGVEGHGTMGEDTYGLEHGLT